MQGKILKGKRFSSETMEVRRQWNDIFKVLKGKKNSAWNFTSIDTVVQNGSEMKIGSDKT